MTHEELTIRIADMVSCLEAIRWSPKGSTLSTIISNLESMCKQAAGDCLTCSKDDEVEKSYELDYLLIAQRELLDVSRHLGNATLYLRLCLPETEDS